MANPRVLVVFPTAWDRKQLPTRPGATEDNGIEVVLGEPTDEECPDDFDPTHFIDQMSQRCRTEFDGVVSSSDYPGATLAAAIATRAGLPGPDPASVIRCSHKYYSRLVQRDVVPEATPPFYLIDPRRPEIVPDGLQFPCFIKPVKGAFSVMARRLDSPADLRAFLSRPAAQTFTTDYVTLFNTLVESLTDFDVNGSFYLAEGFLHGTQVTVEGFEYGGDVEILGIVDSIMRPGTGSFARFDYPSALRPEIQAQMADIVRRVVRGLGLRMSMFNVEMIYEPASDAISIVEVNPRLCGQFADLYHKVDGVHSYDVALELAVRRRPQLRRGAGQFTAATSFPLRTYRPVRVRHAPDAEQVATVASAYPGAIIWWECETGQTLSDFVRHEDGWSVRYAVVNLGADSRAELRARLHAIEADLDAQLEPL